MADGGWPIRINHPPSPIPNISEWKRYDRSLGRLAGHEPLEDVVLDGHRVADLAGPVGGAVGAGGLGVGEGDFLVHQELGELDVAGDEAVVGAAVEVDVRQLVGGDLGD